MPRQPRHILANIPHHVIQRGNNRQNIFFAENDYTYFLTKLKELTKKNHVGLGAYCLMTNHLHLLMYPENSEGMIQCMKLLGQYYTQYINRTYGRSGKLWENRYKIHWIDPDAEWVLSRYIEKNPVRAGMVKLAEEYGYSSARFNLEGQKDSLMTKMVVCENNRAAYRKFFHENDLVERQVTREVTKSFEQERAYGGTRFIEKLETMLNVHVKYRKRGRPTKK